MNTENSEGLVGSNTKVLGSFLQSLGLWPREGTPENNTAICTGHQVHHTFACLAVEAPKTQVLKEPSAAAGILMTGSISRQGGALDFSTAQVMVRKYVFDCFRFERPSKRRRYIWPLLVPDSCLGHAGVRRLAAFHSVLCRYYARRQLKP